MPVNKDKKRLQQLQAIVAYHQKRYHEDDAPEISDQAYDALVAELAQLEKDFGVAKGVASNIGGQSVAAFSKVKHQVRQWSFDNIFDEAELRAWDERVRRLLNEADVNDTKVDYVVEHKIDGLKLVIEYQAGKLVRAATRGDGEVGEDVTHTAMTIKSLPSELKEPVSIICVGEVWLAEDDFLKLNDEQIKNNLPTFANPRNAAAGSLRQLDPEIARRRQLSLTVYDLDFLEKAENIKIPRTQWEELEFLKDLGLPVNQHSKQCSNITAVQEFYLKWQKKSSQLPYGVDGVVIKLNDVSKQKILGYTAKSPRFGVAYKFPAVEATTIVEDIQLQVGRTGVITPVAHLRPVRIDGSTVSRATLHNEDNIKRLDVRVGDTIILRKAGDIIPEIVSVLLPLRPEKTKPYHFPSKVLACGGNGEIERVPGEAAYRCVSLDSATLHRQRLYYFVGKTALNIDGVGPKIIDAFLDNNLIASQADLFTLTEGDIKDLPGFKDKSAANIIAAINKARVVPLQRFLVGLSIESVGEETAKLLADSFGSLDEIRRADEPKIAAIYGIGPIVAKAIVEWFKSIDNNKLLDDLLVHIKFTTPDRKQLSAVFKDKIFVLTGTLASLTRDQAKEAIQLRGGKVTSSVSAKTDFVLVGADPGSKAKEAEKLGISILSESEFLKYMEK